MIAMCQEEESETMFEKSSKLIFFHRIPVSPGTDVGVAILVLLRRLMTKLVEELHEWNILEDFPQGNDLRRNAILTMKSMFEEVLKTNGGHSLVPDKRKDLKSTLRMNLSLLRLSDANFLEVITHSQECFCGKKICEDRIMVVLDCCHAKVHVCCLMKYLQQSIICDKVGDRVKCPCCNRFGDHKKHDLMVYVVGLNDDVRCCFNFKRGCHLDGSGEDRKVVNSVRKQQMDRFLKKFPDFSHCNQNCEANYPLPDGCGDGCPRVRASRLKDPPMEMIPDVAMSFPETISELPKQKMRKFGLLST